MADPYLGEVRLFAGNFAPLDWAFCDGQTLSIAENVALFSLIGTTYGGDGQTTFMLPDLRGRVPVHQGPFYVAGQAGGAESVTLQAAQMPRHTHAMLASTDAASVAHGPSEVLGSSTAMKLYGTGTPTMAMDANAITAAGGGQPHENMPPFVAMNYIIALGGIYPTQS